MSNIEPTPFGDKYVLVEHIATGGMAEIYRAHYAGIEGFAKELVVKTLRQEFAARPEVVSMFLHEARIAATLHHNNVVHTYDLGELGGEYFIAMELLRGQELVNVMRRAHQHGRTIPLEIALGILMQSCEGLYYVHALADEHGRSLDLVHRDINPTNIHVGYDGVCRILDFGIAATRASAVAKKGQVAGKLSYMAPEQLQGQPLDQRADIFALGIVMYELTLGRRLFRGTREEIARRVLEGDIPPPTFVDPTFPPGLEAVIMKALELDPADRYGNCDHVFRDLEAFTQEQGLAWTHRRISAFMQELFGAGVPAVPLDHDDYDDLGRDPLDFDAFEHVGSDDETPDWARSLEQNGSASSSSTRRRVMTIGNLEALVQEGRFDHTGPYPAVRETPRRGRTIAPSGDPARSGHHKIVPLVGAPDGDDEAEFPRGPSGPEGKRTRTSGRTTTRTRLRPELGSRTPVTNTTGSRVTLTTATLTAVEGGSGRSFGSAVVNQQAHKTALVWTWILGLLVVGGLSYLAYTLFTSK